MAVQYRERPAEPDGNSESRRYGLRCGSGGSGHGHDLDGPLRSTEELDGAQAATLAVLDDEVVIAEQPVEAFDEGHVIELRAHVSRLAHASVDLGTARLPQIHHDLLERHRREVHRQPVVPVREDPSRLLIRRRRAGGDGGEECERNGELPDRRFPAPRHHRNLSVSLSGLARWSGSADLERRLEATLPSNAHTSLRISSRPEGGMGAHCGPPSVRRGYFGCSWTPGTVPHPPVPG